MRASTDTLADAIRALRRVLGETQEGMARAVGVSKATYQFWEAGEHTPSGRGLLKLQALCPDPETRLWFDLISNHRSNISLRITPRQVLPRAERLRWRMAAERALHHLFELANKGLPGADQELKKSADRLASRARHWSRLRRNQEQG